MSDISFLGGSGYICSSIRNADFEQKFSLKFFSRRKSNNCFQYDSLSEISKSEIIFDFSQWANGKDIEKYGLSKMHNHIIQAKKKCRYYIFISTLSIDINKKCNYKNDGYTDSKFNFEKFILTEFKRNAFILRIPSCFSNKPKNYSLIKLLFDRANGSNSVIKQPHKYTTGVDSQDIFDFVKILIEKPDIIPSMFGEKKILCLGDGYVYQIKELDKFLKTFSQTNFDLLHDLHFPKNHKINIIQDQKWYLQSISFPVKLLKALKIRKHNDIYNC